MALKSQVCRESCVGKSWLIDVQHDRDLPPQKAQLPTILSAPGAELQYLKMFRLHNGDSPSKACPMSMASNLRAMASDLRAMASNLVASISVASCYPSKLHRLTETSAAQWPHLHRQRTVKQIASHHQQPVPLGHTKVATRRQGRREMPWQVHPEFGLE